MTDIIKATSETKTHVIDTWLGFLGSAKPNFIDTSLLGNVKINIQLNSGDLICQGVPGAAAADTGLIDYSEQAPNKRTFTIDQQHFNLNVISISDGIYDNMIDQMLASGRPIEVPFKNYLSYTETGTSMTRNMPFNVASQSIDRLWAVIRAGQYNSAQARKVPIEQVTATAGKQISDHTHPYFSFSSRGATNFQFQVNNTTYPNYASPNAREWFQLTKLAIGDQGNMLAGSYPATQAQYLDNYFVFATSLEHQTDGDERFVSGIDTRGASASCMFKSSGPGTNYVDGTGHVPASDGDFGWDDGTHQVVVFAELTSLLRIMANKVVEIIQ